jgi:tRNA dimethylallyltransferase
MLMLDPLRYRTLILWLYSDPKILEPRLDGRVEKMLEVRGPPAHQLHIADSVLQRGLLDELKEMREIARKNQHVDMSKGIYQAIGYKEFSQYFDADNDKDALLEAALEDMKLGTRQYSRKQVKWLRNQTVPAVKRVNDALSVPDMHIYVLDATDLGRWQSDVQDTAVRILRGGLLSAESAGKS